VEQTDLQQQPDLVAPSAEDIAAAQPEAAQPATSSNCSADVNPAIGAGEAGTVPATDPEAALPPASAATAAVAKAAAARKKPAAPVGAPHGAAGKAVGVSRNNSVNVHLMAAAAAAGASGSGSTDGRRHESAGRRLQALLDAEGSSLSGLSAEGSEMPGTGPAATLLKAAN
jgi:hypothetical protein